MNQSPLAVQLRVIGALMLREMHTRYGRSPLLHFFSVVPMLIWVTVLSITWTMMGRVPPVGSSFPMFFASGMVSFRMFIDVSRSVQNAIQANSKLLFFPIVTSLDAVFARAVLEVTTGAINGIVVLFLASLFGGDPVPIEPATCLLAFGVTALFAVGFGLMNGVLVIVFPMWSVPIQLVYRPLYFISGVIVPLAHFPPKVVAVLAVNPVLHVVEWFREGYYPQYAADVIDVPYLLFWTLGSLLVGLFLERTLRARIQLS